MQNIKGMILPILVVGIVISGMALAEEPRFETTTEGIIDALSKPQQPKFSKTRSFSVPSRIKTRQVKVSTQERGIIVVKKVDYSDDPDQSKVNLKIEFDVNSYVIRASSYRLLNELGQALSSLKLKNVPVVIKGHTDSDGDDAHNLELSMNRAISVRSYLTANYSIPASRLKVMGFGEAIPLVPNDTMSHKQLNRRVEIQAE